MVNAAHYGTDDLGQSEWSFGDDGATVACNLVFPPSGMVDERPNIRAPHTNEGQADHLAANI